MSVSQTVKDFVTLAIQSGGWMEMDRLYLENRVIAMIGENSLSKAENRIVSESAVESVDQLLVQAEKNQVIKDLQAERDMLEAQLMDLMTPPPSVVNAYFAQYYSKDPVQATDYFFKLSKDNDYIKTREIARNIIFPAKTEYGELEITINLSKPEKDPKQIAAERQLKQVNYPDCMLCMENEGYKGRMNYPARTNHRIIRMNLDGESWGFQYSPYAYYNEHCIVFNGEHVPMKIDRTAFVKLFDFVRQFPHYFLGSNADLPIVGGSILSHDHFQGGHYQFAMADAKIEKHYTIKGFEDVETGILNWPLSVLRIRSKDENRLIDMADHVLKVWREYSDGDAHIYAQTGGEPHNTITPIARKTGETYELDLTLRNNITTAEHPLGLFHPHEQYHHIKKENIGLIEVMGLAVLPSRLKKEMELLAECLVCKTPIEEYECLRKHVDWAEQFVPKYKEINKENVMDILKEEIGQIFVKVLEDAGVYKCTEKGRKQFERFIFTLDQQ